MVSHNVPVTPGYHGADQSPKTLKAEARKIGYPVLIKAIAGGGGRGMRRVDTPEGFDDALASAQREAKASFGDDRVLVEKFIENPRHIEVQVFGDSHGNYIHLFERDCSLQRRRQKVIEEAPAPGMTDAVRAAMTSAAIDAARAVGYQNAGTIEFIVDGSGALRPDGFWFMEMNTRLQVEHPVTEMITGLDLVELQLNVAAGGKLPAQSSIRCQGHAFEARLCAEDPERGFMPSSGRLDVFDLSVFSDAPAGGRLRLDSAVEEGDVVPATYDSMIAKAIAHAETRDAAMDALGDALRTAEIWPLATNAVLLANLLDHPVMREGKATTNLVEADLDELSSLDDMELAEALILGATGLQGWSRGFAADPWSSADGFRINASARANYVFDIHGPHEVRLEGAASGQRMARIAGDTYEIDAEVTATPTGAVVGAVIDGAEAVGVIRSLASGPVLFTKGRAFSLKPPELGLDLEGLAAGDDIRAPMPGKVLEVKAKAGATVKKGAPLVVLEAMKMEHTLSAPRDGKIAEVAATAGQQTTEGVVLVRMEPVPEAPAKD
jgi:acetyl/propionyl-CoA carboxylase alpha subunit